MYDGPIIDTHHHLWEVRNYPWLMAPMSPKIFGDSYELLRQDYLIDDLLSDFGSHNIVKSVHVQAHYDPSNPVGETQWLQAVADKAGFPHGIAGYANLSDPGVEAMLAEHCAYPNFRAIRDVVYWQEGDPTRQAVDRPDYCLSAEYRRGVALLEKYGLSLELQGYSNQFDFFAELVGDNPGVNFCLVHGGLLTGDDDATFDAWRDALPALVALENLFVKCSAANTYSPTGTARSQQQVGRQYNTLLDMFGAERCFFGSNFPVEKLNSSYDDLMAICQETLASRSPDAQRAFFHDTAARFYRI
jgi:predicted TIM-barrel fold metal-dependent hydrolase